MIPTTAYTWFKKYQVYADGWLVPGLKSRNKSISEIIDNV